jgi:hypothetical protein
VTECGGQRGASTDKIGVSRYKTALDIKHHDRRTDGRTVLHGSIASLNADPASNTGVSALTCTANVIYAT